MTDTLGTATVMGAGAWGTALTNALADAGNGVRLWAQSTAVAEQINSTHRGLSVSAAVAALLGRRTKPE